MALFASLDFDPSAWHDWLGPIIGALVGVIMLGAGRLLMSRRPPAPQSKEPVLVPQPTSPLSIEFHDPFLQGSASERRQAVRRQGSEVTVQISDADAKATPSTGWVLDRSATGLRVEVSEPVSQGTVISVRPVGSPAPWTQLEVKSCRLEGKSWALGCQFCKPPPYSVLMLFG
jgi:hypothetical protein